jgi:hypothetical protein
MAIMAVVAVSLLFVSGHEGAVHLLEGIALQGFQVALKGGSITAAQGAGKREARSAKSARDGFKIRQHLFAGHSEVCIELEEELTPKKSGEVSCQNAQRMITFAPPWLDEERGVRQPGDQ